ncbi:integrase arm-type DNA-binding domain-containing protein [Hydrogenovibrio sp. 3SP14C1]|uniref:tyrosine-type recombinase/integrase n=1 Tax=Hydrogenovibrio sp. 3SP14C1 TaxID=3038774 RepID=UPI0024177259|nr:integrase arm-type DNA-binding domain-containing protein [Hydrogenovibrio sp. 3SP14C1]MDG4812290.1 integrase arm-type DNA-binding domain-containing protein [Hydrogenovibrio sp. 3SP14C1]
MLTISKINRFKRSSKLQRHLDADGLYLEVSPVGSKKWRYRYKNFEGNWTMKSLGPYPETSLERARELRDEFKIVKDYQEITFEKTALEWLDYKDYSSEKNKQIIQRRIENYLLPQLGAQVLSHIRPKDILPILKQLEARGYLELARRVQNITSQIFKYGVQNLYCESNPAEPLQGCTKKPTVKHMSAIVEHEAFADLVCRIELTEHLMPSVKLCLQIAPYVFLRSESIRMAKPEHLDFKNKLWIIPKDKMGREHWIPLTDSMIQLLQLAVQQSDGDFLFNGSRPKRPLSENTLNLALRSIGIDKNIHVFHGFRSSFSTLAREALRLDGELIELQLGHVKGDAVRVAYDRSQRLEERREMMQAWSDYLDGLKGARYQ